MKVIIAGGRDFNNYNLLEKSLNQIFKGLWLKGHEIHIITGGARGADRLGNIYALKNSVDRDVINANWDKHGKSAGIIRNAEMAKIGDMLIAFWDGKSRGTKNMIEQMNKLNKKVFIIKYGK